MSAICFTTSQKYECIKEYMKYIKSDYNNL